MNYFLSGLLRDKQLWVIVPSLSALAALILVDLITYMLTPAPFFNLWVVKITLAFAVMGTIGCGLFLHKREKKEKNLHALLPGFLDERRRFLEERTAAHREFQTFCHECRHFDPGRLGCLLVLRDRTVRIRLNDESWISHCLYWNLDDAHPVMQLTGRRPRAPEQPAVEPATRPENSLPNRGNPT